MAKGNSLGLELPAQDKPGKESFDTRPRRVAAWVGELPVGNIGETTKLLYQALHDVNRHSHSWRRRYRFLEAIREPLNLVQQSIGRRYTGQGFPLPQKTQQIARLSQKLYTEMAIGYKTAMADMLGSLFLFQDRRALKTMVHRTARYLSQSILTSYQVYSQQHTGAWQELHHLYAFAEARNFHQDPVVDRFFSELPKSSVARVYKQIVLLASTSPFRLRQGEAMAIYEALARWSAHARLLNESDEGAAEALFILHTERDGEPDYRAFDPAPCTKGKCRLLDTRQLVHVLEEESGYATTAAGNVLTPELFSRLIQSWGVAPKRGERRVEGGQGMHVVVGMTRIHNLLAPALHDEAMEAHLSQFASRAVPVVEIRSTPDDLWNSYAPSKSAPSIPDFPTTSRQEPQQPAAATEVQLWEMRNESHGGFRLAIPESQSAGVRVGEVVAMRGELSREHWQLGVIRWIRQFPHSGMEAGVQVLAPQMVAIMVKNLTPGKDRGEHQRGLLLPAVKEHGQPATLITPNRIFLADEKVRLHVPHNEIEVTLSQALQDSGTFVQFEFHPGNPPKQPNRDKASGTPVATPFEKLWQQL